MSVIEQFAKYVIETIVVKKRLPEFVQNLRKRGIAPERINAAEALIYVFFAFDVMATSSYFREECDKLRHAMFTATEKQISKLQSVLATNAKQLLVERLIEYAKATFDMEKGCLSVSEKGLTRLARVAFKNITSDQPLGLGISLVIWSHFSTTLSTFEGGAVLRKLYDGSLKIGVEQCFSAWVEGLEEGEEECKSEL